MTDKTNLIREIHEYVTAHGGENTATHLLVQAASAIQTQAAELEAVGAGGVQALSAAPGVTSEQRRLIGVIADKIEDGTLFQSGIYPKKDLARFVRHMLNTTPTAPAASPTPPAEQAAPKAAPGVGNSGFDHKTAADFLNGKTISDEAVRKFVAASRWAHDERAALSATLLAMHGVLTSREAEIALLKKALLEAETAPQPAPAPLSESIDQLERELAIIGVVGAIDGHDVVRRESVLEIVRRAALAAQGGKA